MEINEPKPKKKEPLKEALTDEEIEDLQEKYPDSEKLLNEIPEEQEDKYSNMPPAGKTIGAIAIITYLAILIKYMPQTLNYVFKGYFTDMPMLATLFYMSFVGNMVLFAVIGVILLLSGKYVIMNITAWLTGRPILIEWGLDNRFNFRVPKKIYNYVWPVSKTEAAQAKRNAVGTAPHKTNMMLCIPEVGVGISPHDILKHQVGAVDMEGIRTYGTISEMEGYESGRKEDKNDLIAAMPYLTIFIATLIIVAMVAYPRLANDRGLAKCQDKLTEITAQKTQPQQQNDTITVPGQKIKQSNTGAGIS